MEPFIYRECRATITARIPDTPDADAHPDRVLVQGRGTAHPQFQGGSVVFPEIGEYAIPQPIPVVIVDGELLVEVLAGDESVETQPLYLPVTVDERANQNWSWRLTFDFLTLGEYGEEVKHPPLSFPVEAGDGPLEISTVAAPVVKSSGFISRGPRGASVVDATQPHAGSVAFTLSDGTTTSPVDLPEGPEGPEGPAGRAGRDGANVLPTDQAIAQAVSDVSSATSQSLLNATGQGAAVDLASGTSALTMEQMVQHALLENRRQQARAMPRQLTILDRSETSPWLAVGASAALVDEGWRITVPTAGAAKEVYIQPATPRPIAPAQTACMKVFIPDPTGISNLALRLFHDGVASSWNRGTTSDGLTLKQGWNTLRFKMANGLPAAWEGTALGRIGVQATTTQPNVTFTVERVWLECPEKAKLIFILDRGYKTFINRGGLDDCRRVGIPITWALDITTLGRNVGDAFDVITEADVRRFASVGDSISFHGWDGAPTAGMTPEQAREDTRKSVEWLRARGYAGRIWRAAWVQDTTTPEAAANMKDLVLASAQWSMPSVRLDAWPPMDRYNIARFPMMIDTAQVAKQFDILRRTRGLMPAYNHGIQDDYQHDATPAEWAHFIGQVEAGVDGGWLECTTFENLFFDTPATEFGL